MLNVIGSILLIFLFADLIECKFSNEHCYCRDTIKIPFQKPKKQRSGEEDYQKYNVVDEPNSNQYRIWNDGSKLAPPGSMPFHVHIFWVDNQKFTDKFPLHGEKGPITPFANGVLLTDKFFITMATEAQKIIDHQYVNRSVYASAGAHFGSFRVSSQIYRGNYRPIYRLWEDTKDNPRVIRHPAAKIDDEGYLTHGLVLIRVEKPFKLGSETLVYPACFLGVTDYMGPPDERQPLMLESNALVTSYASDTDCTDPNRDHSKKSKFLIETQEDELRYSIVKKQENCEYRSHVFTFCYNNPTLSLCEDDQGAPLLLSFSKKGLGKLKDPKAPTYPKSTYHYMFVVGMFINTPGIDGFYCKPGAKTRFTKFSWEYLNWFEIETKTKYCRKHILDDNFEEFEIESASLMGQLTWLKATGFLILIAGFIVIGLITHSTLLKYKRKLREEESAERGKKRELKSEDKEKLDFELEDKEKLDFEFEDKENQA